MWGVGGTHKKTHMRSFSGVSTAEVSSTSHTWKGSRGSIPVPYGVVNYSSASVASCVVLVEEWHVVLMSQSHHLHSSLRGKKWHLWGFLLAGQWEVIYVRSRGLRAQCVLPPPFSSEIRFSGSERMPKVLKSPQFYTRFKFTAFRICWNRNSNRSWHPRNNCRNTAAQFEISLKVCNQRPIFTIWSLSVG